MATEFLIQLYPNSWMNCGDIYSGYEINKNGHVRDNDDESGRVYNSRIYKKSGYTYVMLKIEDEMMPVSIHTLMKLTHLKVEFSNCDNKEDHYCIKHIDGNKRNNSIDNLQVIKVQSEIMKCEKEIWKSCKFFDNKIKVSNLGNVMRPDGILFKPNKSSKGVFVTYNFGGKRCRYYIYAVQIKTFLDSNFDLNNEVKFVDGNNENLKINNIIYDSAFNKKSKEKVDAKNNSKELQKELLEDVDNWVTCKPPFDYYDAHPSGYLKNNQYNNGILETQLDKNGYHTLRLLSSERGSDKKDNRKPYFLHTILIRQFLKINIDFNIPIEYKDGNKNNNHFENFDLENTKIYNDLPKGEWKQCSKPYDKYDAHTYGYVRHREKGNIMSPTERNGEYLYMALNSKDIIALHTICILTFKGEKPGKDYSVDHIDRNPKNNHIDNLRWATKEEQAQNQKNKQNTTIHQFTLDGIFVAKYLNLTDASEHTGISTRSISRSCCENSIACGFKFKYVDKDIKDKSDKNKDKVDTTYKVDKTNEIFTTIMYKNIILEVSTVGTIKLDEEELNQNERFDYRSVRLNRKDVFVHRLVALAFIENDDPENKKRVIHIDGNLSNNCYTNLQWATNSDVVKNYLKNKNTDYCIHKVDINNNIVKSYKTIKEAADDNNVDNRTLFGYIKRRTIFMDHYWIKDE